MVEIAHAYLTIFLRHKTSNLWFIEGGTSKIYGLNQIVVIRKIEDGRNIFMECVRRQNIEDRLLKMENDKLRMLT